MTALDRELARVRALGFGSVELRCFPNGWGASLDDRDDWSYGRNNVVAIRRACDAYECSIQSEPENKRDRQVFAHPTGPSSTTSPREA